MIVSIDGKTPVISEKARIAENAVIVGDVEIGDGASVWYGAVVRGDAGKITIGENSVIEDNVTVHAHTSIGSRVTVGHNAIVHGCTVCDDCLIGMGSTVMDRAVVGEGSLVAAGTLITGGTEIPASSVVMGNPGKAVRSTGEKHKEMIAYSNHSYQILSEKELPLYTAEKPEKKE